MSLTLVSPAFADGAPLPRKYTQDGDNLSPPLKWTGAPDKTRSFALVVEDPDAPNGTTPHWAIYNIPADQDALPESVDTGPDKGIRYGRNYLGNASSDGPAPPPGHGTHHYHFRLADEPTLSVPANASVKQVWREAEKHAIEETELVATYGR